MRTGEEGGTVGWIGSHQSPREAQGQKRIGAGNSGLGPPACRVWFSRLPTTGSSRLSPGTEGLEQKRKEQIPYRTTHGAGHVMYCFCTHWNSLWAKGTWGGWDKAPCHCPALPTLLGASAGWLRLWGTSIDRDTSGRKWQWYWGVSGVVAPKQFNRR